MSRNVIRMYAGGPDLERSENQETSTNILINIRECVQIPIIINLASFPSDRDQCK